MPTTTRKTVEPASDACLDRLASLRRGELAAIASYRRALGSGDAPDAELAAIVAEHEEAAQALARRVEELGGELDDSAGAWGGVTEAVEAAAKMFGRTAATTALRLGEEHGIAKYEEALSDGVVDSASKDLILTTLLPLQRAHVVTLDRRIAALRERGGDSDAEDRGMDRNETKIERTESAGPSRAPSSAESGKVGVALLMWLLGVPGILILAYLLFS